MALGIDIVAANNENVENDFDDVALDSDDDIDTLANTETAGGDAVELDLKYRKKNNTSWL